MKDEVENPEWFHWQISAILMNKSILDYQYNAHEYVYYIPIEFYIQT